MGEGCDKTGRCSDLELCPENHVCHLCLKAENTFENRWIVCGKCRGSVCLQCATNIQKIPGQKKSHHILMMDALWKMVQLANWEFLCADCMSDPMTICRQQVSNTTRHEKPQPLPSTTSDQPPEYAPSSKQQPFPSSTSDQQPVPVPSSTIPVKEEEVKKLARTATKPAEGDQQQQQQISSTIITIPVEGKTPKRTTTVEFREIKRMISDLKQEIAGIRATAHVDPHQKRSYRSALLKDLPAAPATPPKKTEKAIHPVNHEVIAIGVSEDIADLRVFAADSSKNLECTPPKDALRLGRPGPKPRLIRLTFSSSMEARSYLLASEKARQEKRIAFRTRPGLPREVRPKLRTAASLNRDSADHESFSLRSDGQIWKFTKTGDLWKRDASWSEDSIPTVDSNETKSVGN